ncbi:MAG TPA: ABC transporter ATP-binding protein [Candidatus Polarisedimenticolaceae bacterium]
MEAAIETRALTKRFGAFTAVDAVDLDVRPGEIFGLLGSNGAGKSTTIRMLCGLMRPTSGSIRVLDVDVANDPEAVKHRIGYMTQRFSLYDDLTVRQNLEFYGGIYGLHGKALRERVGWAIESAELAGKDDAATKALSAGWKQRLALVCSMMHAPRVVFLDEPTGGVDPISRRRFWERIDALSSEGVTVVVTTHYLDEAEHCHRIALIHAGRRVALGTVAELKEVFAGRAILEVASARPLDALDLLERHPSVLEASMFGTRLHVVVEDPTASAPLLVTALEGAGLGPARAERIVPSLEDVFIHSVEAEEAKR